MNILVCFTTVPDLEMLDDQDWIIDENLHIDTHFLKPRLDTYDESALEIALKLLDASKSVSVSVALEALTVAGPAATPVLKTLNALRFNRVVRIDSQDDLRFRPRAIASILTQYVCRQRSQDVLLLGRQNSLGENGKTHLLAAEMLGWPCITQVTGIELVDQHHLTVTSQTEEGQLQQTIQTPCVICVGDAPNTYMRVPTLTDRMQYGRRPIKTLSMEAFQLAEETETLMDLKVIRHVRPGLLIQGETPEKKARELYEVHLKERLKTD